MRLLSKISLRYFERSEFACKHTGINRINDEFLANLDELRHRCGFPFVINSGYRHKSHPVEVDKSVGGTHTKGIAADVLALNGRERGLIVKNAVEMGCFNGIGIEGRFIHLDMREGDLVVWSY